MTYLEEAEMALLGSIYIKPSTMGQVLQVIPGDTFFGIPYHRTIYRAYIELHREGKPIDIITLVDWLKSRNLLQEVGGDDYLIQLGEVVPSASNAIHYANIVREKWAERTILNRAEKMISDYNAGTSTFQELYSAAQKMTRGRLMPNQFAFEVGAEFDDEDEYMEGLLTGFPQVDELTSMNGIPMGQLTVIGADTGGGKSFFSQQVAKYVARNFGRVGYVCFGGDLDTKMLRYRWVKQACGIFPHGRMTKEEKAIARPHFDAFKDLPIIVYESEQAADDKLETALDWIEAEHISNPFSLVIFDYAQEINTVEKTSSGVERVEIVAKRTASLAKRLKCGVILASQVTADGSTDFRYSQQLKHSAGLGFVIQTDTKMELMNGMNPTKITVVKNRWGFPSGTLEGFWNPKFTRFESL